MKEPVYSFEVSFNLSGKPSRMPYPRWRRPRSWKPYTPCRCGKHKIWFGSSLPYYVPWFRHWYAERRDRKFHERLMAPAIAALARRIEEIT